MISKISVDPTHAGHKLIGFLPTDLHYLLKQFLPSGCVSDEL